MQFGVYSKLIWSVFAEQWLFCHGIKIQRCRLNAENATNAQHMIVNWNERKCSNVITWDGKKHCSYEKINSINNNKKGDTKMVMHFSALSFVQFYMLKVHLWILNCFILVQKIWYVKTDHFNVRCDSHYAITTGTACM